MKTTTPRRTVSASSSPDSEAADDQNDNGEASNVTHIDGSAEIVEGTEGEKIALVPPQQADAQVPEICTAVVPKTFTLTRDSGAVLVYEAGTCEMPVDDADHWFARAQGVKIYKV